MNIPEFVASTGSQDDWSLVDQAMLNAQACRKRAESEEGYICEACE